MNANKDQRKIGRHHFAFYRGWLQGLTLETLADQYLEDGLDMRVVKTTLHWIRDTLSQSALRHGRKGYARLLRISLRHIVCNEDGDAQSPSAQRIPTLEEFAEAENLDDFYSESELIALYAKAFPEVVDTKAQRRRRLIEQQLIALTWIEDLVATEPERTDWVTAWFSKTLADRLLIARIYTLGDLLQRIDEKGYRWWAKVPGLGEKGAARIIRWLQTYEKTLGPVPINGLAPLRKQSRKDLVVARERTFDIVPLELLQLPVHLTGENGTNRDPVGGMVAVNDDLRAIELWINSRSGSPHTARAYRKEGERLMLWAVLERGKALSSLTVEDCIAYQSWLSMLGRTKPEEWRYRVPVDKWIGPHNRSRLHKEWRPFHGPLSLESVKQALVILRSMFLWFVKARYCSMNPWDAVNSKPEHEIRSTRNVELTRVLSQSQWGYLVAHSAKNEKGGSVARTVFILALAYGTGMRISELVKASTNDLYSMPIRGQLGRRWMLRVFGKGGKARAVPIGPAVMQALSAYLVERGLPGDPALCDEGTPLIAHAASNLRLSTSGMAYVMSELFESAAAALESDGHKEDAETMRSASAHWIRHSRGSHLSMEGLPLPLIQLLLGHASLTTTSIYTKSQAETLYTSLYSESEGDREGERNAA